MTAWPAALSPAEIAANQIAREAEVDAVNFGVIAKVRRDLRNTLRWNPQGTERRLLSNDEARRCAYVAMARLGTEDETRRHEGPNYLGEMPQVGPYVSHAVRFVLRDVETTEGDRRVVQAYAYLANVAARI